jgi:hypothetical protein
LIGRINIVKIEIYYWEKSKDSIQFSSQLQCHSSPKNKNQFKFHMKS